MAKLKTKDKYVGKVKLENGTGSVILTATTTHEELSKYAAPHVQEFMDTVADPAPAPPK